ncbi:MAG: hypothetical protein JXA60_11235 [Candidatus Coatesbacteria bacterium]|nr:hypothetical protein [Candidatus Coatesbacteria bacterium]
MGDFNYYDLGFMEKQKSMLFFHALAIRNEEALVIVSPRDIIASIGYFQNARTSIDFDFCKKEKIPVMRRMVGGGTTLLDNNQIFYQIILKHDNLLNIKDKEYFFEKFSIPAINTYKKIGIETRYKPVNDIITIEKKKITGQGAGEIGECIVFVGGILLDFDYDLMSRILKVPDDNYRNNVYRNMQEGLTTVKRELGYIPDRKMIVSLLKGEWEKLLGNLKEAYFGEDEEKAISETSIMIDNNDFLFGYNREGKEKTKISSGNFLYKSSRKTKGGLLEIYVSIKDDTIAGLKINGDFMCHPVNLPVILETDLIGTKARKLEIENAIEDLYKLTDGSILGVSPSELSEIILSDQRGGE